MKNSAEQYQSTTLTNQNYQFISMKILKTAAITFVMVVAASTTTLFPSNVFAQADERCDAFAANSRDAISAYNTACPSIPRVDCDLIKLNGQEGTLCANYVIGSAAPGISLTQPVAVETTISNTPVAAEPLTEPEDVATQVVHTFTAATLAQAEQGFRSAYSVEPIDCDPSGSRWICSSETIAADTPSNPPVAGPIENSNCDYSSAPVNSGWGWNPVTRESCAPVQDSSLPSLGAVPIENSNCDYSSAPVNNGWGWNPVTGESCAPVQADSVTSPSIPTTSSPVVETPVAETSVVEAPVVETPVVEAPVVETPVVEAPIVETPVAETPVVETPVVETPVAETPVVETPVSPAPATTLPAPVSGNSTTGTIQAGNLVNYGTVRSGNDNPRANYADSYSRNGKCYIDSSNFDHGAGQLVVNTPYGNRTVLQIDAAQSALGKPGRRDSDPRYNDVQCGNGPENNAGDEDVGRCPGRVDQGNSGCGVRGPQWDLDELFGNSRTTFSNTLQSGDFLSLHFDSFPDYDDLQAIIATREFLNERPTLSESSDFTVVIGTVQQGFNRVIPGSVEHSQSMFPETIDATPNGNVFKQNAINSVASMWQLTIQSGGTVFVAEGGAADFTASVVRELQDRNVYGLKNRIRVIQHSAVNERNTISDNMRLIENVATYITTDDGNRENRTPNFNVQGGTFRQEAENSRYGSQWQFAFDVADESNTNRIVDFSDFVEVFEIFGIPKSAVPTPAAFANIYFR